MPQQQQAAGPVAAAASSSSKTVCVAGTYDGGIVGWELRGEGAEAKLQMVFAYTPHQGSIRALAIPKGGAKAGALLVSGGSDEHIRLYDLRRRAEAGELLYHKGTVTCLGFVGSTHLLSGSDDGTVCIWRVYDWSLLHVLGGHKGPVTALAVHPSGKLALTTGRDRSLRLWDLVNGRCAYITKLEAPAETAKWADDGAAYALVIGDKSLEVRRASDNAVTAAMTHPLRVTALAFLPPAGAGAGGPAAHQHVLTACDDGRLRVVDGTNGDLLCETPTAPHCGRVKEAVLLRGGSEGTGEWRVVTASSDGRVVVWSVDAERKMLVAGAAAGLGDDVRITSLAAYADGGDAVVAGEGLTGRVIEQQAKQQQQKQKQKQGKKGGVPAAAAAAAAAPALSPQALALPGKRKNSDTKSKKRPTGEPQQHEQHEQHEQRQHKKHKQQQHGKGKRPGKDGKGRVKSEGGIVSFV